MAPALAERLSPRRAWRRLVAWCGGSHPVARTLGALLAAAIPVVSVLIALGVLRPASAGGDPLRDSQAKTLEAGSAKVRIDVRTAAAPPMRYVATGTFDFREERGTFTYNLSRLQRMARAAAVEARFFQNVAFLRLPKALEPGRPWTLIDLERDPELIEEAPGSPDGASATIAAVPAVQIHDPTAVLAAMDRAGDVEDLGAVRELGLDVRKYRGTLPAAGSRSRMVATAWIDDADLVRRLELTDRAARSTTTMSFYDFGTPVTTRPPPDAQVAVLRDRLLDAILNG